MINKLKTPFYYFPFSFIVFQTSPKPSLPSWWQFPEVQPRCVYQKVSLRKTNLSLEIKLIWLFIHNVIKSLNEAEPEKRFHSPKKVFKLNFNELNILKEHSAAE